MPPLRAMNFESSSYVSANNWSHQQHRRQRQPPPPKITKCITRDKQALHTIQSEYGKQLTERMAENLLKRFDWRMFTLTPVPVGGTGESASVSDRFGNASRSMTGTSPAMR
jgi:hypothetical protein